MSKQVCSGTGLIEAVDGGHLHWTEVRDNILPAFRINCRGNRSAIKLLPTTFLARLQVFQERLPTYKARRRVWQADLHSSKALDNLPLLSFDLIGRKSTSANIERYVFARLSREGLPPRSVTKSTILYELPTVKPSSVSGFSIDAFEKAEQAHLTSALMAAGTTIEFDKGEIKQGHCLVSPFLAFEQFRCATENDIEKARNACAITGTSMLRAQQQLLHRSYGLHTVQQNPVTFTCAFNHEQAIINCHTIDDDGSYTMTALCKFDLTTDEHFGSFSAWIDAIESWASMYLLLRVKGAVSQAQVANPSPPSTPPPLATNLNIDTSAEDNQDLFRYIKERWPTVVWRNDAQPEETPLQSSIAECGTPFPARQIYGSLLPKSPQASHAKFTSNDESSATGDRRLLPLRTNIPLSAITSSRPSLHARRWSSMSARFSQDGSTTPQSPCRPASLSPCSPNPDAPTSSRSPVLVLQKRLDLAMNEIQDLRSQVENLQGYIDRRMENFEAALRDKQGFIPQQIGQDENIGVMGRTSQGYAGTNPEDEQRTPLANQAPWCSPDMIDESAASISPVVTSDLTSRMPGYFDNQSTADIVFWMDLKPPPMVGLLKNCMEFIMTMKLEVYARVAEYWSLSSTHKLPGRTGS